MNLDEHMQWAKEFKGKIDSLPLPTNTRNALVRGLYHRNILAYCDVYGQPVSFEAWAENLLRQHDIHGTSTYEAMQMSTVKNFGIKGYMALIDALRLKESSRSDDTLAKARNAMLVRGKPSVVRQREISGRHEAGETYASIARSMGISANRVKQLADQWKKLVREAGDEAKLKVAIDEYLAVAKSG